jgi:3-hydroxybutyryl-CoA dehydrogenase
VPARRTSRDVNRIAVVGAGTMGAGIALAAACGGFDVDLIEIDAVMREGAPERMSRDAQRLQRTDALARIRVADAISQIGAAEIAIEAVPEDLMLKQRVFVDLERQLSERAILATNTSSLSVGDVADALADPSRLIGLHFFNPATAMKLVEVVRTDCTDDAVVEIGRAFVEAIGKTAVLAADTPGFIVNRVARPYYLQALRALERDVGNVEDLDSLARGIGFRMGPFELMDLIGLDVNLATSESIFERSGAQRLEPVALQREMVVKRLLGRKTGSGFYEYDGGASRRSDEEPPNAPPQNEDEVVTLLGFGPVADAVAELLARGYTRVERIQNDDELAGIDGRTTILFDVGDGVSDRSQTVVDLEPALSPQAVIFVDAYATPVGALGGRLRAPQRLVGYGILSSLEQQRTVEIVDAQPTDEDALAVAEELFAVLGKRTQLVGDSAALFLGRLVGSIVNEAVYAVQEGVASADDVDLAMRLGTNYPIGPVAWGKEIGGARISRILTQLANAEGMQYGPARALWVLDAAENLEDDRASRDWAEAATTGPYA